MALEDEEPENGKPDTEVLKKKYKNMVEEKRHNDDYTRRLEKKLQKLNESLAQWSEDADSQKRTLELERNKDKDEQKSLRTEKDSKAKNQEERIRESLSDVLYQKPSNKHKQYELDTVRVTFVPDKSFLYPLAFRIDDKTTIVTLRNNACKYWNLSKDDFILKTMANNKCSDEMRVKECFKQGELAQLRLERKKTETADPKEEELKAIMPKGPKARKSRGNDLRFNTKDVNSIKKFSDNYVQDLKKMGGIYFLLKLRDTKPSEHVSKIKLRDIIIYILLFVLSLVVYDSRRPSGQDYWYRQGIVDMMMTQVRKPYLTSDEYWEYVPRFTDVETNDDIWDWLNYTLPTIIYDDGRQSLATYNLLVGFMAIRVQNVRPAAACQGKNRKLVEQLGGACYDTSVGGGTQATADMPGLQAYWNNLSVGDPLDPGQIRGEARPWKWASAEDARNASGIDTLTGRIGAYDGSGYMAQYKIGVSNQTAASASFRQDLRKFRELKWISLATRVVVVSFTIYNFDYDLWLSSDFFFELPPSGTVNAEFSVNTFKPRTDETEQELRETYIDYVNLIIAVVYIFIFVGMAERKHKIKYQKAGMYYYLSLNGITDILIVICVVLVVCLRGFTVNQKEKTGRILERADMRFTSFTGMAVWYNEIFCIEGLLMIFYMYRMLSFFRFFDTIYLMWHSLGRALWGFIFFIIIFMPLFLGFVVFLHSSFGPYMTEFSQMSLSYLSMYEIINGGVGISTLLKFDRLLGLLFIICFYIVVTFILLNVFVTIVVDAYYVVQISSGSPAEQWTRDKIIRWALPSLVINLFLTSHSKSVAESG